jgi:hypothetical protein
VQPAACASFWGTVNAPASDYLILNRAANGSATQALIILGSSRTEDQDYAHL